MLRRTLSRLARIAGLTFAPPVRTSVTPQRHAIRLRPTVELLEARDVPTALTWTNQAGNNDFYTTSNWDYTNTRIPAAAAPVGGDDVTFDSGWSNANCTDLGVVPLGGSGGGTTGAVRQAAGTTTGALNSLNLIDGYSGTVTVTAPLQVGTLALTAAPTSAIAQSSGAPGSDITVTGAFTWTNGTLNSNSNGASLFVQGTGTVAPLGAGTVATNDTIWFGGANGAAETATMSAGTVSFMAGSGGVDVKANAALNLTFSGATVGMQGVNVGTQKVTIEAKGTLNAAGGATADAPGTLKATVPVLNSGTLALSGAITATLSGGNANAFDYTQYAGSTLQIQNLGIFTVATGGMDIQGGTVLLTMNPNTVKANQNVNVIGNITFEGGTIQFGPPIMLNTQLVYGTLSVNGSVTWTGGTYEPGVDYTTAGLANQWKINGTLTIPAKNTDAIQPVPQNGKNPPAKQSWDILTTSKVANNNRPTVNKDANNNQLTLTTAVVNNQTVWTLNSP